MKRKLEYQPKRPLAWESCGFLSERDQSTDASWVSSGRNGVYEDESTPWS